MDLREELFTSLRLNFFEAGLIINFISNLEKYKRAILHGSYKL